MADDAYVLFQKGSWSTAVALAVLAREEIGRSNLLAEQARKVRGGGTATYKAVRRLCDDHVDKLRKGFVGTMVRVGDSEAADLEAFFKDPNSDQGKAFRGRLDAQHQAQGRRQHHDAYELKLRSLYVDLSPTGEWLVPSRVTRDNADEAVRGAAADCANTGARFLGDGDIVPLLEGTGLVPSFRMPLAISRPIS